MAGVNVSKSQKFPICINNVEKFSLTCSSKIRQNVENLVKGICVGSRSLNYVGCMPPILKTAVMYCCLPID